MADKGDFQSVVDNDEFVTIPSGTTTSTHFDCKGMIVKGINIPSAFTSASLRLQSSPTIDGVYNDLYNQNGVRFDVVTLANRNIRWDDIDCTGEKFIRFVSASNEAADRQIRLILIVKR